MFWKDLRVIGGDFSLSTQNPIDRDPVLVDGKSPVLALLASGISPAFGSG